MLVFCPTGSPQWIDNIAPALANHFKTVKFRQVPFARPQQASLLAETQHNCFYAEGVTVIYTKATMNRTLLKTALNKVSTASPIVAFV